LSSMRSACPRLENGRSRKQQPILFHDSLSIIAASMRTLDKWLCMHSKCRASVMVLICPAILQSDGRGDGTALNDDIEELQHSPFGDREFAFWSLAIRPVRPSIGSNPGDCSRDQKINDCARLACFLLLSIFFRFAIKSSSP
jgi:hypothetical protein